MMIPPTPPFPTPLAVATPGPFVVAWTEADGRLWETALCLHCEREVTRFRMDSRWTRWEHEPIGFRCVVIIYTHEVTA